MLAAIFEYHHLNWLGDLHLVLHPLPAGLMQVAAAIVCGTVIGLERKYSHKPAGMRTVTLICLGSTIYTMTSVILARGNGDPSRIASQVVTGIGFLGAGAILRNGGSVKGLTTAATIWVVAALGVFIGAGYVVPAIALSFVVLGLLRFHGLPNGENGDNGDNAEDGHEKGESGLF